MLKYFYAGIIITFLFLNYVKFKNGISKKEFTQVNFIEFKLLERDLQKKIVEKIIEENFIVYYSFIKENKEPNYHLDLKDYYYKKIFLELKYNYGISGSILNEFFVENVFVFYNRNSYLDKISESIHKSLKRIKKYNNQCVFDPRLIYNIISVESNFKTNIITKYDENGVMQIKSHVYSEFTRVNKLSHDDSFDLLNIDNNIFLGIWLLCRYYEKTDYKLNEAIYSYNQGINKYKRQQENYDVNNHNYVLKVNNGIVRL